MLESAKSPDVRRDTTREPLAELARFSFDWAPMLCNHAVGCRAYHQGWSTVRLLETGGAAPAGEAFLTEALRKQAGSRKTLRVLLSAAADTGLAGIVLRALRPVGIEPQIVLIDICQTTLQQNRLFAQAADFELETHFADIADHDCAPADAIIVHGFLNHIPLQTRPPIVRSWERLLVPGGVLLMSQRVVLPGTTPVVTVRSEDVAARLERLELKAKALGYSDALFAEISKVAVEFWAMRKGKNPSYEADLRQLFADAGIPVEDFRFIAKEPSVSPFPMPDLATQSPRAEIVCRKPL